MVKYNGKKLVKDRDYTVKYANNKAVGNATVMITGIGKYGESVKKTFKINPKSVALSAVTPGTKQLTVTWKKGAGITGYEIQYSLKKTFASAKKVTITKAATVKTVIKKLQPKKTYYVRIRTYKTVKKVTYYSKWSAKKTVKTKGKAAAAASNQETAGTVAEDAAPTASGEDTEPMLIIENAAEVPEADDPGAEAMVVLSDE